MLDYKTTQMFAITQVIINRRCRLTQPLTSATSLVDRKLKDNIVEWEHSLLAEMLKVNTEEEVIAEVSRGDTAATSSDQVDHQPLEPTDSAWWCSCNTWQTTVCNTVFLQL